MIGPTWRPVAHLEVAVDDAQLLQPHKGGQDAGCELEELSRVQGHDARSLHVLDERAQAAAAVVGHDNGDIPQLAHLVIVVVVATPAQLLLRSLLESEEAWSIIDVRESDTPSGQAFMPQGLALVP